MIEGSVLALDPGESTGWCFLSRDNQMEAGTAPKDHGAVYRLIMDLHPDTVVYESFNLYPGKAQKLVWNSFYPCEVIGVIRLVCQLQEMEIVKQAPSVKKYAGSLPPMFVRLSREIKLTEHSKDACQHLCYYLRQVKSISRVFD